MPRRRKRAARGAGGRREDGAGPETPTPIHVLAAELYGNNPRIPLAEGKAFLRIEPAPNTKVYYSQRGERKAVTGAWGAAIVVDDPDEELDFDDDGRLRLRVMSADELEAFGWRLIRYAQYLRIATALGLSRNELASAYWGGKATARKRRDETPGEEEEPVDEEEYAEEEYEEVA